MVQRQILLNSPLFEHQSIIIFKRMSKLGGRNHQDKAQRLGQGKYNHISHSLRKELINMVVKDDVSVYRASKILGINNSTGKVILRNYRKRGHIFKRKQEREDIESSLEEQQQLSNNPSDQQQPSIDTSHQSHENSEVAFASNYYPFLYYPHLFYGLSPLLIPNYGANILTDL